MTEEKTMDERLLDPSEGPPRLEVPGYRLDGNVPLIQEGRLTLAMQAILDDLERLSKWRTARTAFMLLFLATGVSLSFLMWSVFERTAFELMVVLGFYVGLCVWLDESWIKPTFHSISPVTLTFAGRTIRWTEGMEVGYLYYDDVERIVMADRRGPGEDGREERERFLIVEDSLGKRIGVSEREAGEDFGVVLDRLRNRVAHAQFQELAGGKSRQIA